MSEFAQMLALSCDTSNKVVEDLVSAFVQALHAVRSSECTAPNSYGEDVRQLVSEFDGLPGAERDRVAGAITLLWDAFYERFDGLSGFLAAEYHGRHAYLKELEVAQERMARNRKEIEHLKAQLTRSAVEKQKNTEECERVTALSRALAPERAKYGALEREFVGAQDEMQRLNEQVRMSVEAKVAAEANVADQTRALAQEREKVAALSLEIDLARQEVERATEKTKLGADQESARERARAAALERDLRAARKELQRLREERETGRADQENARERARAAALDRDLRAARKELQRLREERETGSVSAWPFRL